MSSKLTGVCRGPFSTESQRIESRKEDEHRSQSVPMMTMKRMGREGGERAKVSKPRQQGGQSQETGRTRETDRTGKTGKVGRRSDQLWSQSGV